MTPTIEIIGICASCLSLLGLVYNARMRVEGYYIWIVANLAWIPISIMAGAWYQTPIWVFFAIGSVYGIYEWKARSQVQGVSP